jgi:hypothetical protein
LLEVNFIRYRNYTVVPFPFRLIEMSLYWKRRNLQKLGIKYSGWSAK